MSNPREEAAAHIRTAQELLTALQEVTLGEGESIDASGPALSIATMAQAHATIAVALTLSRAAVGVYNVNAI